MDTIYRTQEEAAHARSEKYLGNPCKYGHDGLRYTSNGSCIECTKAASAARTDRIRKLLSGSAA